MERQQLTDQEIDSLDTLFGDLLEDYKTGLIAKEEAMGTFTQIMQALAAGQFHDEIKAVVEQGRSYKRI